MQNTYLSSIATPKNLSSQTNHKYKQYVMNEFNLNENSQSETSHLKYAHILIQA